jgi:hypothetical protein
LPDLAISYIKPRGYQLEIGWMYLLDEVVVGKASMLIFLFLLLSLIISPALSFIFLLP